MVNYWRINGWLFLETSKDVHGQSFMEMVEGGGFNVSEVPHLCGICLNVFLAQMDCRFVKT